MSRLRHVGGTSAIVALLALAGLALPGSAGAAATWIGGPGCGGHVEWHRRPASFPYFCDGAAVVEKAHWSHWGAPTATARAIMNEADLSRGTSVAAAPRIKRAVTITATKLEICSGREAYTSVKIRLVRRPARGPRTRDYPSFLPHCVTAPSATTTSPVLWTALEGSLSCGPTTPPLKELMCHSAVVPAPPTPANYGETGFVFLHATGAPEPARVNQGLWPEHQTFTALAAGSSWTDSELAISCTIGAGEVRCTNSSGQGFTITPSSYSAF